MLPSMLLFEGLNLFGAFNLRVEAGSRNLISIFPKKPGSRGMLCQTVSCFSPLMILSKMGTEYNRLNRLYLCPQSRRRLPIGLHGAIIPFVWVTLAFTITRIIGFTIPVFAVSIFPFVFPVVVLVHYLLWKHLVSFFTD